ncbi:MAG: Poly-beta-1,6-N-acetyl-D-glucosamine synthase [Nitrosomonadaceae bacterium]|nr:Poly-beta-1,6-N-acetyl-D-glucosamine synthase [Nitrosomonadaceae bacterium]
MRALFFLRHYNDVDHITPVISKWVDSGHGCDVILIGFEYFRNDFRIEFLKKLPGVRVTHIQELLAFPDFIRWRVQMLLLIRGLRLPLLGPIVNAVAEIYNAKRREPIWRRITQHLLTRTFEGADGGVVAFDWVERNSTISVEWVEIVVSMVHDAGLSIVSLPHGDSPHASQLIRRNELKLGPDTLFSAGRMFDRLVVPNELCAGRFRPFMDNERISVLGSPRYCDEWLTKLATLLPPTPLTRSDSKLKVLMFLRKSNFTTFWEEVSYVVQLIASFPGVELMIKPHTRGGWQQTLTRDSSLRKLSNVSVAGGGVHSAHLLEWADVIVDLATSVSFEAVKVGKPVLAADYLIAGRSTVAHYMPETELRCRDDVYEKIDGFLRNGCDSFYIEEHRQRFIDEMLHVGGPDVLPRFVALLESQARTNPTAVPIQQKESVLPVTVSTEKTEQLTVLKEIQSNDRGSLSEELPSKLSDETIEPGMPSIDVIIPVYNAHDMTKQCIDSVVAYLGRSIRYIYVQDDASGAETREMLDQLPYECVRVHHSLKNQGFGLSVNEAIGRSDATYVLVLNSDTKTSEDFLPMLCAAMEADPKLAVIIPSGGNYYSSYDFDRYPRQLGGYILTHRLRGFAFLIRRDVFQKMGGFDPLFGRGYYEDIDLGRRLDQRGWRMGVHPNAAIYHKGGSSFGRGLSYMKLVRHNRNLYFARYPNAKRNILLFSDSMPLDRLPANLLNEVELIFRSGGYVHWLTDKPAPQIWCIHMPNRSMSLGVVIMLSLHGWLRADKQVSEIWILPNISPFKRSVILFWSRATGIKVRLWDDATAV